MRWYGDPDQLDVSARRVDRAAEALRERIARLRAEARRMRWKGVAAAAFVTELEADLGGLESAADRLEAAADHLHRHADEVRRRAADLRTDVDLRAIVDAGIAPLPYAGRWG